MKIEQVLIFVDNLVRGINHKPLSDLQTTIIQEVWEGKKYSEIADIYSCTEGHVKDAASELWKLVSDLTKQKITKSNFKTAITHLFINREERLPRETKKPESVVDINFLGREQTVKNLEDLIAQEHKIIVLQGQGGIGKTTLAKKFLASQKFDLVLELLMAKETVNIISVKSVVEEWLKRDFQEEPGLEFGVSLARFKRHLLNNKVAVIIDNFEPALDKQGQLINQHRDYLELLRVLADPQVNSVTLLTSRDRLCEPELNLIHYCLPGLEATVWRDFFTFQGLAIDNLVIPHIQHTYGGNPKAMRIIASVIQEDFAGDTSAYWQENQNYPLGETNLKNLVAKQFDRLQQLDTVAYNLLCRLGCYRFQDIPTIDNPGIMALLPNLPTSQQRQTIKSLRNRSLIEFEAGEYWLHPVIRAEALSRLAKTEWEATNRAIAEFYTASVSQIDSLESGLKALEAYYHYYAVADFLAAGKVILYSRTNQWGQHLTLGTHLHRLGLSQPLLAAIMQIIHRLNDTRVKSELNNILGDLYWIRGEVRQAIAYQEVTITNATAYLEKTTLTAENKRKIYYWKMLQVDSLLSIGLYHIDLWELASAKEYFKRVIALAAETKHHAWAEKAQIALALVDSHLNKQEAAKTTVFDFLALIAQDTKQIYNTGRFAYFLQLLGQTLINLDQENVALDILNKAIAESQESHYIQIKAKATTSLGIIARKQKDPEKASQHHLNSIVWLENIGAKCDLAEAYYQYALTLLTQDLAASHNYKNKALKLFQQMDSTAQIVRIQQELS